MDPVGPGRVRGFRATAVDPVAPEVLTSPVASEAPSASAAPTGQAEVLQTDRPPTSGARPWLRLPQGNSWRFLRGGRPPHPRVGPRRWRSGNPWAVSAAAVLVVAMVIISALAFKLGTGSAAPAGQTSPTPTPAPTVTPLPVTDLYTRVVPSVVLITTSKGSLGSGSVVTDTGTVLTANHVISGGGVISVQFADGTKTTATVASRSPETDIATLTPKKLPEVVVPATLGGGVAVGSDVVAIGNPLGLQDSTTSGIVSGLHRTTKTESGSVPGLIQFDAAVNPGSSGGPLLDNQGLVVGVVVSIADPGKDDAFAGIGFAVPIGTALGGGGDGPGQDGGPRL